MAPLEPFDYIPFFKDNDPIVNSTGHNLMHNQLSNALLQRPAIVVSADCKRMRWVRFTDEDLLAHTAAQHCFYHILTLFVDSFVTYGVGSLLGRLPANFFKNWTIISIEPLDYWFDTHSPSAKCQHKKKKISRVH